MNRRILGYGLWLLLTVSPALGSPLVSVSDQYMLNTNAQRQIPILVSSSPAEQVEGVDLAVQIGDGGTVNGGVNTAPRITNLDVIGPGTIFHGNNTGTGTLDDGTPLPVYLGSAGNNLIAATATSTSSGTVGANGVLAWLTVNPSGAPVGSAYQVILQNVGANYVKGPWTSDFGDTSASFPAGIAYIHIVNLHQTIWNAGASGAWTNATWTDSAPPFPNYTCQAVVDTHYTVNVTSPQEANSLAISGGGQVAIDSAGSLSLTTDATIANGSNLQVSGTLNAQNVSVNGSLTFSLGGSAQLANISGTGTLSVGDGLAPSILTADSIQTGVLSIAAGSTVTINPIPGGPLSAAPSLAPVPEPSTLALLIAAAAGIIFSLRR
ncbi:MAG: PEP-CTERM sorting domain-containing protein [Thermoguttaceae bacterium]